MKNKITFSKSFKTLLKAVKWQLIAHTKDFYFYLNIYFCFYFFHFKGTLNLIWKSPYLFKFI